MAPTANAARSDGQFFPCTDAFAKQVAIASGFVEVVNAKTRDHFSNSNFWDATQTVCADFDQDGNDEMVFSLSSMGGTDPWAFFDIPPSGLAPGATYSFPTIQFDRLYPNHRLELVRWEGNPAIRDIRRLFRPRDAHCCPTGGLFIRVIGTIGGGYEVLSSEVTRPRNRSLESRTCGLLPGDGGYSYVKVRGITCQAGKRVAFKARKRFCSKHHDCLLAEPGPTYRGRVRYHGWTCHVKDGWELLIVRCRKRDMRIFYATGA